MASSSTAVIAAKKESSINKRGFETSRDILSKYDPANNRTNPVMSKYERSAVLGMRIEQLARGAQPFVDVSEMENELGPDGISPENIAERELMQRKLPFIIKRTMPNGTHEYWRIEDMIVF